MTEPVEEIHLLLAVATRRVVCRQVLDQLADARSQLVGEVRRRRTDEPVDLLDEGVAHRFEAYRPKRRG